MPSKEFLKYLDSKNLERLRIRLKVEKGEVTALVCQYESFIKETWHPIVRYDTSHGFFHRDVLFPDGTQEKYALEIENLKIAVVYAEQDIKDRWEFYKNRYIKKLK